MQCPRLVGDTTGSSLWIHTHNQGQILNLSKHSYSREIWIRKRERLRVRKFLNSEYCSRVNQVILAGKRGSHHHSTMSFSVNVVVAETSYRMLEVLSFCDGKRIKISANFSGESKVQWSFLEYIFFGSFYVSWKLPTYPSPKPAFCPKWEVSVNVGLGEG